MFPVYCYQTRGEKGDPLGFFNIYSVAKHQKIEGSTLWRKKIRGKSLKAEKHWMELIPNDIGNWSSTQVRANTTKFCETFSRININFSKESSFHLKKLNKKSVFKPKVSSFKIFGTMKLRVY